MKRRGRLEGSIYQRKDGRWTAVIQLAYGPNGQRIRRWLYGKTRAEVSAKLGSASRAQAENVPLPREKETVGRYLEDWLETVARPSVRPRTYDSYAYIVRKHLVPSLGRTKLVRLTPQQVQELLNAKSRAGLAPRTVGYVRAVLRQALNNALRWGLVTRNVASLAQAPRAARMELHPLTPEQARAFIASAKDDRLVALYTVAVAIGLRQGEALGLQWQDVDFDRGTLSVRQTLTRSGGRLIFAEPKTDRSRRTVRLPAVAVVALRAHRARQLEERLLAGSRWQDHGLVFASTIGTPLDSRNVTRHFQELLARAALPRQRFHDLRHACATFLLAGGESPRVVMEILGHSQIGLTLGTYSHVIPALQTEAARRMDAILTVGTGPS